MAVDKVPMTQQGYQDLNDELQERKAVIRPRIVNDIAEARAHGDLSENAEYHAAKEAQGMNEGKIAEIESQISRAEVIDVAAIKETRIVFGASVSLMDLDTDKKVLYRIVGDYEANVKDGKISISSPIARQLIGKSAEDFVDVKTPGGEKSYEILSVDYK